MGVFNKKKSKKNHLKTKTNKQKYYKKNHLKTKTNKQKYYKKNHLKTKTNKTKYYKKKGGAIIGKGKDGFIIDSVSYDNYNKENGFVAKIFKQGIKVNIDLNNKLKEIDPNGDRFLQYIIPDTSLNKDLLRDNEDIKEYIQQNNFLFDGSNDIVFIKKFNPINITKLTRNQYRYLRDSLNLLHKNNISHGDLPENVLVDPETDNPIIIDWENSKLNADELDKRIDLDAFMNNFKISKTTV